MEYKLYVCTSVLSEYHIGPTLCLLCLASSPLVSAQECLIKALHTLKVTLMADSDTVRKPPPECDTAPPAIIRAANGKTILWNIC